MFAGIKTAIINALGVAEHDAEAMAKALHDDVRPMLDELRTEVMADVRKLIADAAQPATPAPVEGSAPTA